MSQMHFFSTGPDLLPLLLAVEAGRRLKYVVADWSHVPRTQSYASARDIPDLGRARGESAILCSTFLVMDADTPVVPREIRQYNGIVRYSFDPLLNPDSVALRPGGIWKEDILLSGTVGTASDTRPSQSLMRLFRTEVRRRFARVKAFWVGTEARAMLRAGKRLTDAEQCPREYDLADGIEDAREEPPVPRGESRFSLEETCQRLRELDLIEAGTTIQVPDHPPRFDEDSTGLSFFRTQLEGVDLGGLSLPRTFFGRSEIREVSFRGSDLSESVAHWNDFVEVDFRDADLTRVDFRASTFQQVDFRLAVLREADLRHATFSDCSFAGALLEGARVARECMESLTLSSVQRQGLHTCADPGPEPPGG